MKKIEILLLVIITISCTTQNKNNRSVLIKVEPAYSTIDIFKYLQNANEAIVKKLNIEKTDSNDIFKNNPFFSTLILNTKLLADGNAMLDSSAMIGVTHDTLLLKKYFSMTDSIFPKESKWVFKPIYGTDVFKVSLLKIKQKPIILTILDVESVIEYPIEDTRINSLNKSFTDKIQLSKYKVEVTLTSKIKEILDSNYYVFNLSIDSSIYCGYINNFKKQSNQHIKLGQLKQDDYEILKEEFSTVIWKE